MESASAERPNAKLGIATLRINFNRTTHERRDLAHRRARRTGDDPVEGCAQRRRKLGLTLTARNPLRYIVELRGDPALLGNGRKRNFKPEENIGMQPPATEVRAFSR